MDLADENSQVADILYDLVQRETKSFSALFARTLVGTMKTAARLHKSPIKSPASGCSRPMTCPRCWWNWAICLAPRT